ncbi:hypothetical protein BU25DRAFT_483015 [Macroventuria anomochaeta]|uniref:Uncharacterized protein n=1 Tax=Macroventuria anomochaeta TaxID=301207 RepID=A0ACB6RHF3_9PLEO|nr:uncharacterized protein BU25DRAFT_483015 [Macroventuria anomochaeta]KAF2621380.1 hypothetical protein BU25DRAFT_483015 [Macroventuria anomochaeta]
MRSPPTDPPWFRASESKLELGPKHPATVFCNDSEKDEHDLAALRICSCSVIRRASRRRLLRLLHHT